MRTKVFFVKTLCDIVLIICFDQGPMHSYNIVIRLQMIAPPPPPAASAPGTGDGRFDAPQVNVIGWEAAEKQRQ